MTKCDRGPTEGKLGMFCKTPLFLPDFLNRFIEQQFYTTVQICLFSRERANIP